MAIATAKEIEVGDVAPDFELDDQQAADAPDFSHKVRLSDFRGKKNVVLAFYPLDWSPVCTTENRCFAEDFPKFESANAVLLGISCDSIFSHKAWVDALSLKQRLLSDLHREVAKNYGLYFEPFNCSKRATVIVDKTGIVRYKKVQEILTARDNKEILEALRKLS